MMTNWLSKLRLRGSAPVDAPARDMAADTTASGTAPGGVTGLLDEMRRRLPGKTPALPPAAGGLPPRQELPRLHTAEQWLGLAATLGAAAVVCWIMTSASLLVSAGRASEAARLDVPMLAKYPPLHRRTLRASSRLSPDLARALSPQEDRLKRAWQNIAAFENARAEPVLRATRSTVQAVVPGSAAERAQMEPGDLIVQVNGKQAGFVWDVYKEITERPLGQVDLTVQRGTETLQLTLRRRGDEPFDMTNHGLLFAVPAHVRFIGATDVDRLSAQLRSAYLDSLPEELRGTYIEGFLTLSNDLVGNLSALAEISPDAAGYVRIEDLVAWYHHSFRDALGRYRQELERARARQSDALVQLGWALLAGGCALLLALAFDARRRWSA